MHMVKSPLNQTQKPDSIDCKGDEIKVNQFDLLPLCNFLYERYV